MPVNVNIDVTVLFCLVDDIQYLMREHGWTEKEDRCVCVYGAMIYLNQYDFRDMDSMTTEHFVLHWVWPKCPGQMVCQVGKRRGWAPVVNSLPSISAVYTLLSLRQQTLEFPWKR